MRIAPEHISSKEVIGTSSDGHPIVMIETKGGLFAVFTKNKDGQIASLGAAPHRGIALWLAEKKDPELKWNDDVNKSEPLIKSEQAQFDRLRKLIFSQVLSKSELDASDTFFVYDTVNRVIEVLDKKEIECRIVDKEIDPYCVVRPIDLSSPVDILAEHPVFKVKYV